MLKFFYRSWTELVEDADGNADWLLAGEEADVHGLLRASSISPAAFWNRSLLFP